MAVFFAWHVLRPQATESDPFGGSFEWFSVAITLATFIALWRHKVGIIRLITANARALAGLADSVLLGTDRWTGARPRSRLHGLRAPRCWVLRFFVPNLQYLTHLATGDLRHIAAPCKIGREGPYPTRYGQSIHDSERPKTAGKPTLRPDRASSTDQRLSWANA